MEGITAEHQEVVMQAVAILFMSVSLCRLAASSWLVGRVDEMQDDKKNLFRLDGLGAELRKEMFFTVLYQAMDVLGLPNFGTYMVEKEFVPLSAAKSGLKPKGRLWWVRVKKGVVVSREIIEDNGAISMKRIYPKDCYTDPQGNLASQIIVCGENMHDRMAPDECFADTKESLVQRTDTGIVNARRSHNRTAQPKFNKHSSDGSRMTGLGEAGSARSHSDRTDFVQGIQCRSKDHKKFKEVFNNSGVLIGGSGLSSAYNEFKKWFADSKGVLIRDRSDHESAESDANLIEHLFAEIDVFIRRATTSGCGRTFRADVWRLVKSLYQPINRMKRSYMKGITLAAKFEDFRLASQMYGVIADHVRTNREDHRFLAVKSVSLATKLREEIIPRIDVTGSDTTKYGSYRDSAVRFMDDMAKSFADDQGCINPYERILTAMQILRELMADVMESEPSSAEQAYAIYSEYMKVSAQMRKVETEALRMRDLDIDIAISVITLDID